MLALVHRENRPLGFVQAHLRAPPAATSVAHAAETTTPRRRSERMLPAEKANSRCQTHLSHRRANQASVTLLVKAGVRRPAELAEPRWARCSRIENASRNVTRGCRGIDPRSRLRAGWLQKSLFRVSRQPRLEKLPTAQGKVQVHRGRRSGGRPRAVRAVCARCTGSQRLANEQPTRRGAHI